MAKSYQEAYSELYRALSGNCSHDLRVALINQFEQAVIAKKEADG